MVLIFLNWLYIFITVFLCGFAFAKFAEKLFAYRMENMLEQMFFGIAAVTVYAQVFSLFGGVGAAANVLLSAACIFIAVVWRKEIRHLASEKLHSRTVLYKILSAGIIMLWCYCTSRGYMHYDSDLYHAQSIRWIEEYGIVKGLGNIHVRFAYNSSVFALSALYSMRDAAGQSLHAVNGFIALLLSMEALALFDRRRFWRADAWGLSDFARLGAFYYLTLIYRDIVSPASDYCVMCIVFYIMIRWLSHLERGEKDAAPYSLLCVMGVYAITLKLTAGVILLLCIKPACMLLKEKRYKEIALYLLLGGSVIAVWMARTALLSGYLLYPFPALDVLNVDWKINAAAAALDAAEIKTWGRGLNNAALAELPVWEWFPNWFLTMLPTLGKLLIIADIVCIIITAVLLTGFVIKTVHGEKTRDTGGIYQADKLLVLCTAAVSYLFWQFSAPLLRYGYAYVLLLITLTAGMLYQRIRGKGRLIWCAAVVLAAVKTVSLAEYIAGTFQQPYYIVQQEYGAYEVDSFTAEGVTFYYPKSGDRVGYENFPAVPRRIEPKFRGEGIESGFRDAQRSLP